LNQDDHKLEQAILRLLHERGAGKTICPSEAARAVAGTDEREAWEQLMDPARAAARRLVAREAIVITQGGRVVDGSTAKGPIRLRLR
jgi:nucleoid-associated protein YgaU